jgi:hypothetical protein
MGGRGLLRLGNAGKSERQYYGAREQCYLLHEINPV